MYGCCTRSYNKISKSSPEFTPYLQEIGSNLGYIVADSTVSNEDRTISMRLVLSSSLVKDPPQFVSILEGDKAESFLHRAPKTLLCMWTERSHGDGMH